MAASRGGLLSFFPSVFLSFSSPAKKKKKKKKRKKKRPFFPLSFDIIDSFSSENLTGTEKLQKTPLRSSRQMNREAEGILRPLSPPLLPQRPPPKTKRSRLRRRRGRRHRRRKRTAAAAAPPSAGSEGQREAATNKRRDRSRRRESSRGAREGQGAASLPALGRLPRCRRKLPRDLRRRRRRRRPKRATATAARETRGDEQRARRLQGGALRLQGPSKEGEGEGEEEEAEPRPVALVLRLRAPRRRPFSIGGSLREKKRGKTRKMKGSPTANFSGRAFFFLLYSFSSKKTNKRWHRPSSLVLSLAFPYLAPRSTFHLRGSDRGKFLCDLIGRGN